MVEFEFDIHKTVGTDRVISVWDKTSLGDCRRSNPQWIAEVTAILGTLGKLSAKAQQLPVPITSFSKLQNSEHRLYLYVDDKKAIGMLKVGTKKLFIRTNEGRYHEIEPLCVLDFYVHESYQRSGVGKMLFEVMLEAEHAVPHKMGYDRPSPKLLGFLRKHYGLSNYIPQANNFVVYNVYFDPHYVPPATLKCADADAKTGEVPATDPACSVKSLPPPPPPPQPPTAVSSGIIGMSMSAAPKRASGRHLQQHALPPLSRPF